MRRTLRIKEGPFGALLDHRHFRPTMARIIESVLQRAPRMKESGPVVVTCGADSHDDGAHPEGDALDFRGNSIEADSLAHQRELGRRWAAEVQLDLGGHYESIYEAFEGDPQRDHLHVQSNFKPVGHQMAEGLFLRIASLRSK